MKLVRSAGIGAFLLLACMGAWGRETYEARPGLIPFKGFLLFYHAQGPLSSVLLTRSELPADIRVGRDVFAKSCQHLLAVPLSAQVRAMSVSGAIGDGGYRKAAEIIRKEHPHVTGIFDVRVDRHAISILGIYNRLCTEVTARSLLHAGAQGESR